jgi:PBSX family phage terminase large subunit
LYPVQHDFVTCSDRFTAFVGGIGSGKSFAGAVKGLVHCDKPSLGLVVAPTYPMLRDATIRSYQEVAGDAFRAYTRGDSIARIGKAEILFRSADKPDRLRGPNINWAHIDEAGLCPNDTWDIIIGRLRADGKAGDCWATSTPKGHNWLYAKSSQMTLFRSRTRDNPYLSVEFIESLEESYTGGFARQELEGEFVSFEGLVYEEFDRSIHVRDNPSSLKYTIAGLDEGYTNPAVILIIGVDNDGRLHVADEYYQRRQLPSNVVQAAKDLKQQYNILTFHADPSAAGLIAEMQSTNLPVFHADNSVMLGINAVKGKLHVASDGRPRLTISPSCVNLIAELESYVWKQNRFGMRDEPEKANDHACDALRYAVMAESMALTGSLFL